MVKLLALNVQPATHVNLLKKYRVLHSSGQQQEEAIAVSTLLVIINLKTVTILIQALVVHLATTQNMVTLTIDIVRRP